ncbi:Mechanosensitive channel MscK precursor [Anatilimnocola aggregata]|uniref:Mechanosensitive channel MscK n=1 Tax=Anatilimnocola aggregata TaxID=2528021 RepID=A0A517Y8G7_9BACT|nr:mechanosensitive ion channel domain-containing protein [Anatilimnocola aggregata]QDU26513.1 Mechanosensitive channel MscK precursor [Anatilimnocola aggregata]
MKTCKCLLAIALAVAAWPTLAAAQLQLLPLPGQPTAPQSSPPSQPPPAFSPPAPGFRPVQTQAVVPAQAMLPAAADNQPQAATGPATAVASTEKADDLREKFLGQAGEAWDHVASVWNFVLVRGADTKPLVTVGTLFGGLVLMGCGYIAAGMISRWIGAKLLSRFGLNQTARAPLQSISYYVLLISFGMLTLNILNVPITVFSFAGGALAVGVGFGSQNIVNNFISGLILIAERPIRVGDVIEIDGRIGRVTEIGARSTRLATGTNFEVIVPNSKFLENQVVNWTLSDDRICTDIKVGVAYGSPLREVERLLFQAANEHPGVLKDCETSVVFEDFAADSLVFCLRVWLRLLSTSKREVESDIRFRIDELFSQAGIVIAYPQRDVHLNVMRPLEVRLAADATREFRKVAA